MQDAEKPFILIVDDEPDQVQHEVALGLEDRADSCVVHPRNIRLSDMEDADLVLVDFRLDKWSEVHSERGISRQPATGLGLSAILRERLDQSDRDRLTAFALHSAHLQDIRGRIPSATFPHVIAHLNNLEWTFSKLEDRRFEQMVCLAKAVRRLPRRWPQDPNGSVSEVRRLLEVDNNAKYCDRCWRDVLECRVPIRDLTEGTHGILFIRWLLHQVLPHPCFLWADYWVAARLRISVETLRAILAGDSQLAVDLMSMRYSGILAEFLGDRWWREAIEGYVWSLAEECKANDMELGEALGQRARMDLKTIDVNPAVVCVDTDLKPTGKFLTPADALSLRPDYWPPFADSPWVDINTAREHPDLYYVVDPLDRYRIDSEGE